MLLKNVAPLTSPSSLSHHQFIRSTRTATNPSSERGSHKNREKNAEPTVEDHSLFTCASHVLCKTYVPPNHSGWTCSSFCNFCKAYLSLFAHKKNTCRQVMLTGTRSSLTWVHLTVPELEGRIVNLARKDNIPLDHFLN